MARQEFTTAQYRRALQQARERHDLRYEIDRPKPKPKTLAESTGVEKVLSYLWIVWAVLGVAGAFISLPHTLNTVLGTVDLNPAVSIAYSIAVFIGVELALISVALVSQLKQEEQQRGPQKQSSLAGLINGLLLRIGLRPAFDLSHLPDRKMPTGAIMVTLLFLASLVFNMADALSDVPLLKGYEEEILLVSRLMAGALGPGLLLIAGHRFAGEAVKSMTAKQRLERAYERELQAWQAGLDANWQQTGDQWVSAVLAGRVGEGGWYEELTGEPEVQEAAAQAVPFGSNGNGNGHRSLIQGS